MKRRAREATRSRDWWDTTGLLREEPGGWCAPKTRGSIDIDHEKKVDLGVLRGADHDGRVLVSPFSTLDGVCVKFKVTLKLW